MKTAIQLYTLRNEAKYDLEGVLKIVSDAGYDGRAGGALRLERRPNESAA
jgi:sugar phosphate isomerase/epimerase